MIVLPAADEEQRRQASFVAARAHFAALKSEFPEYSYKEAALNPTNLENRTADWEADIVRTFRQPHSPREIISERSTPTGPQLNLARPITVSEESCLACHSQPSAAPASMTALYGTANGFGGHLAETPYLASYRKRVVYEPGTR